MGHGGHYSSGYNAHYGHAYHAPRTHHTVSHHAGHSRQALHVPHTTPVLRPVTLASHAPYGHAVNHGAHFGNAYHGRRAEPSHAYGSIGVTKYDIEDDILGLQGRLGYQATPYLGLEAEGSFGVTEDDEDIGGVPYEAEVNHQLAAFATARLPIGDGFSLRGRIGYHTTDYSITTDVAGEPQFEESDDGIAYGIGAEYAINPRDSIRIDGTIYDIDGSNMDSVSVAYQHKF